MSKSRFRIFLFAPCQRSAARGEGSRRSLLPAPPGYRVELSALWLQPTSDKEQDKKDGYGAAV